MGVFEGNGGGFACLARLGQAITASLALDDVLRCVATTATNLVGDSSARIWVVDGARLVLRAEAGTTGMPGAGRKTTLAFGEGLTGCTAIQRGPLVVRDVLADHRTVNRDWMRRQRFMSYIGLPLLVRDVLVGVLSLHTRRAHDFSAAEVEIFASFGIQAGIAINNARLFEEVSRLGREAQAREAFIRNVVDHLAEGLVVLDGQGRVVAWNQAMERIAELPAAAAVGRACGEALADFGPALGESVARVLGAAAAAFELTGLERRPPAKPLVVDVKATRLTADGAPAGAVLLFDDVTDSVALAQAARQAEKMTALAGLARAAAHEINNPVGIITSRIELMLLETDAGRLPPAMRDDLVVLQRNAQRVARIIDGLRAFARPPCAALVPVDLSAVVHGSLRLAEGPLAEHGITVATRLDPTLPPILGDPGALRQVVLHLLRNSMDAMSGGGEIRIDTAAVDGPPAQVRLVLADTGPGIAAADLPRILEPLFSTKDGGAGLGLAISYAFVRDHRGTMDVRSEAGQGTSVVLTFPALALEERAVRG